MTKRLIAAALLTAVGLGTPVASATVIVYAAELTNEAESRSAAIPGTGFAAITLDDVLDTMRVVVSVSQLTDNTTAANIHCCNAVPWKGAAGVIPTVPKFLEFPLGVTFRSYTNITDLTLGSDAAGRLEFGGYHGTN